MIGNTVAAPIFSAPIGKCIYCSASSQLHDEHALPFALGGNIVIPQASCDDCRRIIQQIERICATKIFGHFRVRTGGPTRDRRKWPRTVPLVTIDEQGVRSERQVDPTAHPSGFTLVFLGHPTLLSSLPQPPLKVWMFADGKVVTDFVASSERAQLEIGQWHGTSFARLLAKIAHAVFAGESGFPPDLEYLCPDYILGRKTDLSDIVGGYQEEFPKDSVPHWSNLISVEHQGDIYFVLQIRLYAWLGCPIFSIIVARSIGLRYKSNLTITVKDLLDGKKIKFPFSGRPRTILQ